ncbi:Mannose-6-phosphate receptor, partial [Trinorchestia longiramus]
MLYLSRFDVSLNDKKSYHVSMCSGDANTNQSRFAVVEKAGGTSVPVGFKNRTLAMKGADWVQVVWLSNITYTAPDQCAGQNRSARLLITCDQDVQGPSLQLRADMVPGLGCFDSFSTSHSLACLGPSPGLGGFSVFLIVLTVLFVVYFLLGVAYMRYVKGAKGIDQLPNKAFWFRTGNAIA